MARTSGVTPTPDSGDLLLVAAGDGAAAQRLLDRWRQPLYTAFERLREPSAAAEATAEVLATLLRTSASYDPEVPFPVHIWGLAAKVAQKGARAAPPAPRNPPAESLGARAALLRAAASTLSPPERAAFLLTRIAGVPFPSAARALGVPEAEVRRTLVRALEALALSLAPLLELPETPGEASPPTAPDPAPAENP